MDGVDAYQAVQAALNLGQLNQPPIISAPANRTEFHRVIESFVLEASIVDDRTPSENLTVKMFINNSVGSVIEVQMEYVNAAGSWIGTYTPDASAPLGVYSAYVWASDNEEGEEAISETFHFTVLNNPPTITSINIMILENSILRVTVEAFDYEGLANAYASIMEENG